MDQPSPNPAEEAEPEGAFDWIMRQRQAAQSSALTSLDDNPDDAGRAMELSNATGADPTLVYHDLDGFQQQHKAAITSSLLTNNQYLRDYANSHPLAAKVSSDDWGQLDAVSQALLKLSPYTRLYGTDKGFSVLKAATQGFKEGFGSEPMGSWLSVDENTNRAAWGALTGIGMPIEAAGRVFSGVLEAARQGSLQAQVAAGFDPNASERRSNELALMLEAELGGLSGRHPMPEIPQEAISKVQEVGRLAKPYVEAGVEPPVGLHEFIDKIHAEQTKQDLGNYDELFKEAQASATRERSPELFANFIRQHTDASIGIDAEAVRKLYGDKVPEADDNILGWVKGIQDQLALAEAHGGDVEVPLADWLAKADPEVAKELHDSLRLRPGGMTLEETKAEKPKEEEEQPEVTMPAQTIDAVRQAANLHGQLGSPARGIVPKKTILSEVETEQGKIQVPSFAAGDALDQVKATHLTGITRTLSDFFGDRLSKTVGDTPIYMLDRETMQRVNKSFRHSEFTPGFYLPSAHAIILRDDLAQGLLGHDLTTHILYHEMAHAATSREMYANPDLMDKVTGLMRETDSYLQAMRPEARKTHSYAFKNEHEFMAEAFSNPEFQEHLATVPISDFMKQKLGITRNVKTVWDAVREMVRNVIQKLAGREVPDSILDGVLHLGNEFEQATAKLKGGAEGATHAAEEIPEEDRALFSKASTIGMSVKQYKRYQELIAKRQAEDLEHQKAQAEKLARQQQTREWKENFAQTRESVKEDLRSRPDIAADRFLREGELFGSKVRKVKIDGSALTPEQRAAVPKELLGDTGIHPDDLAGLFGYQSGDAMLGALSRLQQERDMEGLTPAAHFSRLVDAEADRQMRKSFGDLETSILEEAKDHVISQTQLDLLHEEMLALGTKAHGELSISKEDIKSWVKDQFDATPLSSHSVDKYLAAAGRAGRAAEEGLLGDSPADAFKAKQQQYISLLLANEAKRLEKARVRFDKLAKRFSRREVSGVPAEYTNWIHDVLIRTGNVVRRSIQDLQDAIGREQHQTLESFVNSKNDNANIWEQDEDFPSDFKVMPVAPFLFDQNYRKQIDDMSVAEFGAVHDSLKTLVKNGSDERKIIVKGDKADLDATISDMVDQLKEVFGEGKQFPFGHQEKGIGHAIRTAWASLLQIESIFNRFDRGDPKGLFKSVVTEPIFAGAKDLNTLETKYSRLYKALPKFGDLKKKVENPLFGDPLTDWQTKKDFTRENLLAVLQNVGNPSQLDKLARGYKIQDKDSIMRWLFSNTTKEDWDRAQALGDIFEQAFEEAATMYHGLSGVAPEKVQLRPIETPFGTYKGWYHPIVYDPLRPGTSKKLMGPSALEDGSYYRAATPTGYTKKRTGYAAPINLSFEQVPYRLKQVLNDTAMRPSVTEVSKVFYDPKFQMAVTKAYGTEVKNLLIPYLKDVAGQSQFKDAAQSAAMRYLEYARQNVVATLIGLNPSTVAKHGPTAAMLSMKEVGMGPFFRELATLTSHSDELGEKNWRFAMDTSEELQRRHRNWQETLSGAQQDVFGDNTLRNSVIKFGATPVAISDLLSAVPTWLAAYKDQIRGGASHGDAIAFADRAVRRAHGSSAVAARPRLMRGGPLAQFATPFYTFFNEMFQRQYEMAWRAKEMLGQFKGGEYQEGLKQVPNLAAGLWAYVVFPALVEQMVSPIATGKESTTQKALAWGARTIGSGIPILRDMVEAFLGGRDPTIGLYSTSAKMVLDTVRDVNKGQVSLDKRHAGKTIQHTITAFGAASGLTNAQEGRTARFIYDYANNQTHPKNTGDILRGLWHGTTK